MTDVRLTATNPADSSVVPVAANSKGELLVAEPTVTDINNDVTINGNLTVTGTINGNSGGGGIELPPDPQPGQVLGWDGQLVWVDLPSGGGLPTPYGPEYSFLQIIQGEPAWNMAFPEPLPPVVWSDFCTLAGDQSGWGYQAGPTKMFDGLDYTKSIFQRDDQPMTFAPQTALGLIESLRIRLDFSGQQTYKILFDGAQELITSSTIWTDLPRYTGKEWGLNSSLTVECNSGNGAEAGIYQIEFNGQVLVDDGVTASSSLADILRRLALLESQAAESSGA